MTEFREGGNAVIRPISGPKRYTVCAVARARMAVLDAELPVAEVPNRFIVKVEDGCERGNCLMESLKTAGAGETQNSPTAYIASMLRCRSGRKDYRKRWNDILR